MSDAFRDFAYLLGPYRRRATLVMLFLLGASLLDLCGIGLVWPYIVVLSQPELLDGQPLWEQLKRATGVESNRSASVMLGGLIVLIFYAKGYAHFRMHRYILNFGAEHYVHMVERLSRLYQRAPYGFFIGRASTMLVRQLFNAQLFANQGLIPALRICSEMIVAVAVVTLLAFVNPAAVAILAAVLGALLWVYDRRFRGRSRALGEELARARTQMVVETRHVAGALKELRVLGTEPQFFERIRETADAVGHTAAEQVMIRQLPRYVVDSAMVTFVVLIASIATLTPGGTETIVATLGVFGAAAARLIPSINQLAVNVSDIRFSREPSAALREEIVTLEAIAAGRSDGDGVSSPLGPFERLDLRDVTFSYDGSEVEALRGLDLSIEAGESVGIIGASGAGKTTLIDVLLGLLSPSGGTLEVNGRSVAENLRAWNDLVAYLPQDVQLIDGSVRDNVALGAPPSQIDDARVWRALEQARLRDYVESLPEGLDTSVGEGGERFSGGQRARVALARAFFFERQVFVLDEATASLDHETEAEIVSEIERLKGDKTVIVIAHRLSTVERCDTLYRLEQGRIVDRGSYANVVDSANG